MIITLAIVNTIFLLKYVVSKTDECEVSCTNKGYSSGSCMNIPVSQKPCENIGSVTDTTYNLYCQENNEVCCCK